MLKYITIFLLVLLSSCSFFKSKIKESNAGKHDEVYLGHRNTSEMRILARKSYPFLLTNRVCKSFDKEGKCTVAESIEKFDLKIKDTREMLIQFKFACRVGGKRYRICSNKQGLCRREYGCLEYKKKLITRETYCSSHGLVKSHYLDIEKDFDYLVHGGTECRSNY